MLWGEGALHRCADLQNMSCKSQGVSEELEQRAEKTVLTQPVKNSRFKKKASWCLFEVTHTCFLKSPESLSQGTRSHGSQAPWTLTWSPQQLSDTLVCISPAVSPRGSVRNSGVPADGHKGVWAPSLSRPAEEKQPTSESHMPTSCLPPGMCQDALQSRGTTSSYSSFPNTKVST